MVIGDIKADMEVLTLVGGYNDRRSYDSSNPDWTWLGSMLDSKGNPNMDKTTFYGALNTIASKWYEVCPEAPKSMTLSKRLQTIGAFLVLTHGTKSACQ